MVCVCWGPEKGVLENRQKVVVFRLNDMDFKQKMPSFYAYLYQLMLVPRSEILELRGIRGYLKSLQNGELVTSLDVDFKLGVLGF